MDSDRYENPYAASSASVGVTEQVASVMSTPRTLLVVFGGFIGTVLAGGTFGFLFGFIIGLVVGLVLAAFAASLPFLGLAIVASTRPLRPKPQVLCVACAGCGALSGLLASMPFVENWTSLEFIWFPSLTAFMGFMGGWLGALGLSAVPSEGRSRGHS